MSAIRAPLSSSDMIFHFPVHTSCWHFDDTLFCKPQIWHIKCLSSISFSLGVLHLFIQLLCVPGICQRERLRPIWSPETRWVRWPLSWLKDWEQAVPSGREVLFLYILDTFEISIRQRLRAFLRCELPFRYLSLMTLTGQCVDIMKRWKTINGNSFPHIYSPTKVPSGR